MRKTFLKVLFLLLSSGLLYGQKIIQVGQGSYAEFPPAGAATAGGTDNYNKLKAGWPYNIAPAMQTQPIPTNDWWTDLIFSKMGGELWAYPHAVATSNTGVKIIAPNGFINGAMNKGTFLEIKGSVNGTSLAYTPVGSSVYRWSDIDVSWQLKESDTKLMDITAAHGIPLVWMKLTGIEPVINAGAGSSGVAIYNTAGTAVTTFPATLSTFSISVNGKFFGIHTAPGTVVTSSGGNYYLNTPDGKNYIVVSVLPSKDLLGTYDTYARNKITKTTFSSNYQVSQGNIETKFDIATTNLETGATGGSTIMSFLPHQWRDTKFTFPLIANGDYQIFLGKMKTAAGNSFAISYPFTGLPPYMPAPTTMTATQLDRMNTMINSIGGTTYKRDTYNKELDEVSQLMLMAKELGHPKYAELKASVIKELKFWLTYEATEANSTGYYFAKYPEFGAFIGFAPGFGSQIFNDLHFHYGYYVLAAARVMMVDPEFRDGYSEIVKMVAKTYADWKRYGENGETDKNPFLRTFDIYAGHSWAGGKGGPAGSNQESTSEATMSWFGLYNLGVALNDPEIINMGATGLTIEARSTQEYWLNMHEDNFDTSYGHKYVGMVWGSSLGFGTWFNGDPGWILGIQFCPSGHYMSYLGDYPVVADKVWKACFQDRINDGKLGVTSTDIYTQMSNMGDYLGSYHLGYYSHWNAAAALTLEDKLYTDVGAGWRTGRQAIINYYLTNANVSYGRPAPGYSTSLASGTVYKDASGKLIYLLYNGTSTNQDVKIYNNGALVTTIPVKANTFYNSLNPGPFDPTVSFTEPLATENFEIGETILLKGGASDKDGTVASVELFANGNSLGTTNGSAFSVSYKPTAAGTINFTATATDNDGRKATAAKSVTVGNNIQKPYNTTPARIPGVITGWQYDLGGEGVAYHDNEAKNNGVDAGVPPRTTEGVDIEAGATPNIGWTSAGEWLEYTVIVESAGDYAVTLNKASQWGEGICHLEFSRSNKTGQISVPATGSWTTYNTITFNAVKLEAGEQIMRLHFDEQGINFRSLSFDKTATPLDKINSEDIIIYPNPVNDKLTIKINPSMQCMTVELINIQGASVYQYVFNGSESLLEIDTQDLNSGLYLLKIETINGVISRKIVKR